MAVVVLAALGVVLARVRRRHVLRKRYGAAAMPRRGGIPWRSVAPVVLLLLAGASLVMAFGQVRLNHQATTGTVILAVDVSDSMRQTDVSPNRLAAAKAAAQTFLERLPQGFRVGVVTFAGTAKLAVTPTGDRTDVSRALVPLTTSGGTVIGDGLSMAIDAIDADRRANGGGPAAIVLLTDGQDTGSKVAPSVAAERAETDGIKIFTVAVGTSGTNAKDAVNTSLLGQIASTTDAKTFTATSAGQLTEIYGALGSELSTDLAIAGSGARFVALAAALAVAAGISLLVLTRQL